ncbi:tripartite tricarboxylate transporter TctB family protein [Neptunomonas japonica]|uniref:tripartite tricarboxylate transporter TctB family protein n=1 Tax=Neptunomonas japonica TaxID=417574 RepID=UPI00048DFB21|nr:tripartite tricarboxylate transporter TctB family protein [Neptunomonas japonica]
MMLSKRLTAIGGVLLALILLVLGSNVEYGEEAYFFPNLLAYFLLAFAFVLLISDGDLLNWLKEIASFLWRWMFGIVGEGNPSRWPDTVRLIPMFITIFCYLYFADIVGLYTTSFITFLLITVIYTPHRPRSRTLFKSALIALIFTGVIYLIFSVLLQLQAPSAWFI